MKTRVNKRGARRKDDGMEVGRGTEAPGGERAGMAEGPRRMFSSSSGKEFDGGTFYLNCVGSLED